MSKKSEKNKNIERYTDEQKEKIERHIEKYFGDINNSYSEKNPELIDMSINIIPPVPERPYYTFVTCGMGAHIMNVPEDLKERKLERAELVIFLPPSYDPENKDCFWVLHLLSLVSKLPIKENAWLGRGHSVDYGESLIGDDGFSSVLIIPPESLKDSFICHLPDGENVNFYQILMLYPEELRFKNKNGSAALLSQFPEGAIKISDPKRPCYVPENFELIADKAMKHISKIESKNLDIPEINGVNHIAAFLRWCIEHDMINDEFLDFFNEEFEEIKAGNLDIRKFILNSLDGEFTKEILTSEGERFTSYYYDHYHSSDEPCYPCDVDRMALDYFGEEKYNSDEFQDEAYLFVPYDEQYYESICKYIDENYKDFIKDTVIDCYEDHLAKIEEKNLRTAKKNAVNHITAFLLWSIRHNLMIDDFMEYYGIYEDMIESGKLDIRNFVIKNLDGCLNLGMFSEKGAAFVEFYYIFNCPPPNYPDDVDRMALEYFGEKKYNSKKFKDEAYLFVPFDEEYFKAINKYIDRAYADFCYYIENGKLPDEE